MGAPMRIEWCVDAWIGSLILKRDEKAANGDRYYVWYHENGTWRLSKEKYFQDKTDICFIFKKSTGKENQE